MMAAPDLPSACAATRPLSRRRYWCGPARRGLSRRPRSLHRVRADKFPLCAFELRAERLILGPSGREIPFEDTHLMTQVANLRLQRRFLLPISLLALL